MFLFNITCKLSCIAAHILGFVLDELSVLITIN